METTVEPTSRPPVAVLGATGFVGRHVCKALAEAGWPGRPLARSPAQGGRRLDAVHAAPEELAAAIAGCGAVVNAIGIKRPDAAQGFHDVHVAFMRRLVEACRRAGVGRVVHVSVA